MTTRLSDVIEPSVYQGYMSLVSPELTRFFDSGIIVQNPLLDSLANGPSNVVNIPFWNDLDTSKRPNLSSDDPSQKSAPSKINAGIQTALNAYLNGSWSSMDLVKELAGADPLTEIVGKTNRWWARQFQYRLISSCIGIYLSNVANNSGDMVHNIAVASGSPGDVNKIGGAAAIDAEMTLGDAVGGIGAMAVHSQVFGRLRKLDLIDFIQPSQNTGLVGTNADPRGMPMYQGKQVIVDDGMPVEKDGSNNPVYTTIFYGPGVFGFGNGSPRVPVAVTRDETAGNGAGEEILHERRTWLLHPAGFQFNQGVVSAAGKTSADLDELENVAAWTRVVDRKLVPMAFLRTNG